LSQSDARDLDSLLPGTAGFLSQSPHVIGVAGQQYDRPWLAERHHRQDCIEGALVARQSCPAKQFTSGTALLLVDRDDRHSSKDAVQIRISWPAAQYFGKGRCGGNHSATSLSCSFETMSCARVAACQLDQTFSVEDQGSGYSSS
jgi:hypothetical protein